MIQIWLKETHPGSKIKSLNYWLSHTFIF